MDEPAPPGFSHMERQHDSLKAQVSALFHKEAGHIESALSFSRLLFQRLSSSGKLDLKQKDLLALFYRNCVYLDASYMLIRAGLPDPAANNMRTVFETIIWQYAYLTDDGIYANFRKMNEMDSQKLGMIKTGAWSNTKERALENLRRKYSFQKMLKGLYGKGHYERIFQNQYWAFCQKSHSSLFGINHNTPNLEGGTTLEVPGGAEELRGTLSAALYLCAENLLLFLNCFHPAMGQEDAGRTLKALERINRALPPSPSLAPEGRGLPFTLRLREVR